MNFSIRPWQNIDAADRNDRHGGLSAGLVMDNKGKPLPRYTHRAGV